MKIAIVDVAAESGGALSVLKDFLNYLVSLKNDLNDYYVYVSKEIGINKENIHYVIKPETKKSWLSRLKWEMIDAINEFTEMGINIILSLQNTAFFSKKIKQLVYFHNVLLLEPKWKYSLLKKEERKLAIYTKAIAPYTLRSLKYADAIICQTKIVCDEISRRILGVKVETVNPNVYVDDIYINSSNRPIKGFIYPTAASSFKNIEGVVQCAKKNHDWFVNNNLKILITITGEENEYARRISDICKGIEVIELIGYQSRNTILRMYQDYALIINSELESFPMPFKEAKLVGAPIISADYPYAVEILRDDEQSFIYKRNNEKDMFIKMKSVLSLQKRENIFLETQNTWHQVVKLIMDL